VITLVVRGPDIAEQRVQLDDGTLKIGRSSRCDVVLPGANITRLHAKLTTARRGAVLEDAGSTAGTFVNGAQIRGAVLVAEQDRITIGEYTLDVLRSDPPAPLPAAALSGDPAERELLAELERTGDAALLVYGDWLEQTGQLRRAKLLRLERELAAQDPDSQEHARLRKQLRRLADADDIGWRAKVSRAPIERCTFAFECPKEWSRLARTDREDVRFCGACQQQVFYCANLADARGHALRGECVAVDVSNGRSRGDLEPLVMMGRRT
jgi:uncharacterized protein (TIGR02996 family)